MEFLLGQSLRNNLVNMNLLSEMRQVVNDLGLILNASLTRSLTPRWVTAG